MKPPFINSLSDLTASACNLFTLLVIYKCVRTKTKLLLQLYCRLGNNSLISVKCYDAMSIIPKMMKFQVIESFSNYFYPLLMLTKILWHRKVFVSYVASTMLIFNQLQKREDVPNSVVFFMFVGADLIKISSKLIYYFCF